LLPGPRFAFDNTYARDLEGCYVRVTPATAPQPRLLRFNHDLAEELGLDVDAFPDETKAALFSGNALPDGASPLAQAYAGHQFGGFAPQLGDGRALLLGEVIDRHRRRRDIAFKGSGRTPFSRRGDGKGAVGPMLREYLMGEAMHALGVPTTRALAVVATGDRVIRDAVLPGAVLTRVAASHLRVGTFEFFAARDQHDVVRRVADYAIARHYPEAADAEDPCLAFLQGVTERQAVLLAQWMLLGFIHGVMNTDNMAISGETIDYGPCAFMEAFDERTVFSSIDHGGRYAYGNQPAIARWNLARFAETLLPLFSASDPAEAVARASGVVEGFVDRYQAAWLRGMRAKLGLVDEADDDAVLIADWLHLLRQDKVDWTLAWRRLSGAASGDSRQVEALFENRTAVRAWLGRWRSRSAPSAMDPEVRTRSMRQVNPAYIPRNHRVEAALAAASEAGDLGPFERLLAVVTHPFDEQPHLEEFAVPAPPEVTACYQTYCGT
jgi:uncharacterized protein YdiU (UPF0061 family)